MPPFPQLVLASASPRRQELLRALGLEFQVTVPQVPEDPLPGEAAACLVRRLARRKAAAALDRHPDCLVLAADTVVVLGEAAAEKPLGKPGGSAEARGMLAALSGKEHRVLTGTALSAGGIDVSEVSTTRVRFATLSAREIDWYVGTGEPMDKAGAYGIQGHAALFIREIHGSWSNVVGLPVDRLPELFRRAGEDLFARLG